MWWPTVQGSIGPALGMITFNELKPVEPLSESNFWCTGGYAIDKIDMRTGWVIDALRLRCRNGARSSISSNWIGGTGGNIQSTAGFSGGQFINRVAIYTTSRGDRFCGYKVIGLKYWCASPDDPGLSKSSHRSVGILPHSYREPGRYWISFECPYGEFVSRLDIQYNRFNDLQNPSCNNNQASIPFGHVCDCNCPNCLSNIRFTCSSLESTKSFSEPQ